MEKELLLQILRNQRGMMEAELEIIRRHPHWYDGNKHEMLVRQTGMLLETAERPHPLFDSF